MIATTSLAGLVASLVAVAASAVFVATVLRHRTDPTTRPVIGIAVTLLVGAVLHLAVVDLEPVRHALGIQWDPTASPGGFWTLVAFDLPAIVSVFWFLFALQYTGRDRETTPIALSAVAVLLVSLIGPNVALAAIGSVVGVPASTLNTVLGATIVLAESLALIGVFLVLTTTLGRKAFPATQVASLVAAVGTVLTLPFVATTLQRPVATPVAVTVSALLFTAVVRRHRVFETLPVASVAGRDHVIDEMSEGVLVAGEDGRIRDLNPEAASLFDVDRADAVGEPVATVAPALPTPEAAARSGPRDVHTDAGRTVTVTADAVTDDRDRALGHLLVCRDVTEKRRREHRLGVLTQLVAGATTEQMRTVTDVADAVAAGDRAPADGGERISETATATATLVGRVRRVERALADRDADRAASADVRAVVDDLRRSVGADVSVPPAGTSVRVAADPDLLAAVLETLATAAGTATDAVEVRVTRGEDLVTVAVAPLDSDEEASIPRLALDVAELAAEHVAWSVDTPDGSGGPTASVRLPAASGDARGASP